MDREETETNENDALSKDFRETLRRSGLNFSAFQTNDSQSADFGEEKPASLKAIENLLPKTDAELTKKKKKIASKFIQRKSYLMGITGIVAIIVLQAAFQFYFIQDENLRAAETLIADDRAVEKSDEEPLNTEISEIKEEAKIETKAEAKKIVENNVTKSKKSAPEVRRDLQATPSRIIFRKRESRESTAERLRRAEKILTGV